MPNWCNTTYTFKGEPKEIRTLADAINNAIETQNEENPFFVDNDFGDTWLGGILNTIMKDREAYNTTGCRGSMTETEVWLWNEGDGQDALGFVTETSWCAKPYMWKMILKKLGLKSVKMSFFEEECGMALYSVYDEIGIYEDYAYYFDFFDCDEGLPQTLHRIPRCEEGTLKATELFLNEVYPGDKGTVKEKIERLSRDYPSIGVYPIKHMTIGDIMDRK